VEVWEAVLQRGDFGSRVTLFRGLPWWDDDLDDCSAVPGGKAERTGWEGVPIIFCSF
jgi:hypothetical protein